MADVKSYYSVLTNGSAVWLYDEGWSAQFLIREGCVSEFTLHFRSYALRGEAYPGRPCLTDRIAVAVRQFQLSEQDHGEKIACLEARKHFAWYLRGVSHSSYYKNQITSLTTMEDIYRVARDVVRDLK